MSMLFVVGNSAREVERCTGGIWRWKRKRPWPLDRIRCAEPSELSPRQPGTVVSHLVKRCFQRSWTKGSLAWSGTPSLPCSPYCPTAPRVPTRGRRPNFPKRSTFLRALENAWRIGLASTWSQDSSLQLVWKRGHWTIQFFAGWAHDTASACKAIAGRRHGPGSARYWVGV